MKIYQVDAFTGKPFRGNPAAVCLLKEPRSDDWMQQVAADMNLSETAFVEERGGDFGLRWFTPKVEVNLCGHATLASAHILYETGALGPDRIARFQTRSGLLACHCDGAYITMNFPADPVRSILITDLFQEALGARIVYAGKGVSDILVELETEERVRKLQPRMGMVARFPSRGVIVTAQCADGPHDFVSRFFAPQVGIAEDPVTGSAHCTLASYWASRLEKTEFLAWQASPRGGEVKLKLEEDRVNLAGEAVTVFEGTLLV